jgi:glutamyl-tRNA reductase
MLAVVGISHQTAPVEVRERIAFDPSEIAGILPECAQRFGPAIVLSTCNRTEVYAGGPDAVQRALAVMSWLAEDRGLEVSPRDAPFYLLDGENAVRHLFRVAAGLESLVLGEAQIQGQVRRALHLSQRHGATDSVLVRVFLSATAAGRRLRSERSGAGSAASVSAAAVELASRRLGGLSNRSVLVVSTGEAAVLTARALRERGARGVIAGRTLGRAEAVGRELGIAAIPFHELMGALTRVDAAISATSARTYQIDRLLVERAIASRAGRPMLLIDLAVPRDIDPQVKTLPSVELFDIDDLRPLLESQAASTDQATKQIETALEGEVADFLSWWQGQSVVPTISALRDRAERIRLDELKKTLGRLPHLSADERRRIDALTSAIVKKILHQPIMCLKESEGAPDYVEAVRELFALPAATD